MVMLRTYEGKRFQFSLSEIYSITQNKNDLTNIQKSNSGTLFDSLEKMTELSGGVCSAKGAISTSALVNASFALGIRNNLTQNTFVGVGAGIEQNIVSDNAMRLCFLPVFVRIQKKFREKKISPTINLKLGYAFRIDGNYNGGIFFQTSYGLKYKLTSHSDIFFGIFTHLQPTYGNVVETLPIGIYTSKSNTIITGWGATIVFGF